jgi:hypothetical protein
MTSDWGRGRDSTDTMLRGGRTGTAMASARVGGGADWGDGGDAKATACGKAAGEISSRAGSGW